MSHVETVVHLTTSSLVQEATELQNLQVPSARHHHGHGQQNHRQTSLKVVIASLSWEPTGMFTQKHGGKEKKNFYKRDTPMIFNSSTYNSGCAGKEHVLHEGSCKLI